MPVQHKIFTTKDTIEHRAVANTKYLHQIASTRESALSALCGSRCDFVRSCFAHSRLVSSVINSTDHPILRVPSWSLWLMALEAFDLSVFIHVNLRQKVLAVLPASGSPGFLPVDKTLRCQNQTRGSSVRDSFPRQSPHRVRPVAAWRSACGGGPAIRRSPAPAWRR
jgi:hypothetical protein